MGYSSWGHKELDMTEHTHIFPGGSVGKDLPANAEEVRDPGSILGSGRFPGVGLGNPLQYSYLENLHGKRSWWTTVPGIHRVEHN